MKITTQSEYALLALIFIAKKNKAGIKLVNINTICQKHEISKKYLESILTKLKKSDYLVTKLGVHGGYCLNKKPEKISLAEIIRLMDGQLAPTPAVSVYFHKDTPLAQNVKMKKIMKDIRDYISVKLERLTINDLIN